MDPASLATQRWLEQEASSPGDQGLESFLRGSDVQYALTQVVQSGVEAAVREIVPLEQQDVVLDAVLREGQDTAEVEVAEGADLAKTVMAFLAPRFYALAYQGLEVDRGGLSEVFVEQVKTGIRINVSRHGALTRVERVLLGGLPPGPPFPSGRDEHESKGKGKGKGKGRNESGASGGALAANDSDL